MAPSPSPSAPAPGRHPLVGPAGLARAIGLTCWHCHKPLLPCPLGLACPGSDPYSPGACRSCAWGAICSTHTTRWTRA